MNDDDFGSSQMSSQGGASQASLGASQESSSSMRSDRLARKRSLGRRVSFAEFARMRLIDKQNGAFSPIANMENEPPVLLGGNAETGLKMPDFSTVRKTSNTFNLRLSLDPTNQRQPLRPSHAPNSPSESDLSFEVAVKCSPRKTEANTSETHENEQNAERNDAAPALHASDMEDTVSFRSRSGRRLGDDDEEVSMEIDDEGAEAGAAQATFDAEEARSPSPCEVKSSKLAASSRRDSVAAFFRSPQPPRQPLAQAGPSSRRDSVAPFFAGWGHRSNEDVDEIAAFGGRSGDDHDYNPDEEDDEDGTDTFGHDKISKATAGAAMLQLRNERPRDSIAAFFPDSHADESSQSKSLASAGLRPRDSIAAFFPDSHQADDTQSISFAPRSVNNEAHKRKERARDSVAAFFQDPEGDDDEIAMTGLTALKAHAKNERPRDSVAAFFAGTESDSEEEDSAVVGAVEQGPEDNLRHPEDTNSDEQTSMDITRSHGGRLKQDRPGSALHGPYPPVVPVETPEIIRQSRATRSAPPSKDTTPLRRSSRLRSMSPAASDGLSTPQQAPSKSSSRKGTPLKPSLKRDATPRREATPRSNVKRIKSPDVATTPPELEDVRSSVTLVPPTYSGSASPTPASGPRGELAARKPKESQPATMSTPRSAQKDDLAMMKEPLLGTPKALLSAKRDYHLTPRMQKLLSKTNDEISLPDRNWLRDYDSDKTGPSALPKLFQKVSEPSSVVKLTKLESSASKFFSNDANRRKISSVVSPSPLRRQESFPDDEADDYAPILSRSQMAADFTLKASQQSTQDLLQYEGEENLLDEEPNIVDGSFIAADEPVEKSAITLKEFLKATGLHFIDGLTTTLRRDTTAFSRSNEEPTRLDVIAAANLYMPELSIYEEACKSLSKRIEEDRHSLRELEAEVTENTPPVFYDFFEASESEQENMRQRVKSAKLIARCASKKMWYGFREIIFRPLKEGIALKIQHLRQDIERVGEYSESLEKLILDGQPQLSDLSAKVERMKERHDALSSSDPKMMMLLKRKVDEQRLMIEEIPRTILEHQETVKSLNEEIEQETAKKGTLLEEYDRLERQLEDLRRQQQGDKRGIVETYRLLALTHGWEPYRSRELTAEVGLKWRDRATLESKNGEVLASINMELVLVNEMREEIRKTTSIQRTYSTIEEMPRAMDETSFQLCRMRGLLHDVNQARKVYPIQTSLVEGSDGSKAVVARVSVFDHLTSTKAELLIHFDISRPIAYPSGRFVCSVDIWRGNARSEGEFIEALNLAPRRWGRLARALRDVKSLFLQ